MAVADNAYSRLVAWLKIVLPLAALAILSTLFLFSRTIDPTRAIPLAGIDVADLAREPRINAPDYSGVTIDGTAMTLLAQSAKPDPENAGHVTAVEPTAILETPDGMRIEISSALAEVDTGSGQLVLEGGVRLLTSLGYAVETEQVSAALDRTRLETTGEIVAVGPLGRISAGQMVLQQNADRAGSYLLVFKNGVSLLYEPKE